MAENQTKETKQALGGDRYAGLIYLAVNTAVLCLCLLRHLEGLEYILFLLGIAAIAGVLLKGKPREPEAHIGFVIFIDVLLVFASLTDIWRTAPLLDVLAYKPGLWIALTIAGLILFCVGVSRKKDALCWGALFAWGMCFPIIWRVLSGVDAHYVIRYMTVYGLLSALWMIVVRANRLTNRKSRAMAYGLGLFGLYFFLALKSGWWMSNQFFMPYFAELISSFKQNQLNTAHVLILEIIFLAGAFLLGAFTKKERHPGGLILAAFAGGVLVLKAVLTFFVPGGVLALVVYGCISVKLLRLEVTKRACLTGARGIMQMITALSVSGALLLMSWGLWSVLLAGGIGARLIVKKLRAGSSECPKVYAQTFFLMLLMACLAAYQVSFHVQVFAAIGLVGFSFFLMLYFLNWKHPNVGVNHRPAKSLMCALLALLLVLLITQSGTAIRLDRSYSTATVELEAREKDGTVDYTVTQYGTPEDYIIYVKSLNTQYAGIGRLDVETKSISGLYNTVETINSKGVITVRKVFLPTMYY